LELTDNDWITYVQENENTGNTIPKSLLPNLYATGNFSLARRAREIRCYPSEDQKRF